MRIFNRSAAAMLAAVCLFACGSVHATTISTTSISTWKSSAFIAGGNYSMLNFYPVLQSSYNTAAGITLTPSGSSTAFNFTGPDHGGYYLAGDTSQKTLSSSTGPGAYINIAFLSSPENAIYIGTGASVSHPLTLTLSDGESFSLTTTTFGLSASHSFTWATLSAAAGSQALVDDFWYAASALPQDGTSGSVPAPTPEPATVILALGGALLLFFESRQQRHSAEQIS